MEKVYLAIAALGAAYLLDLIIGDPRWLPHPVRALGLLISLLEKAVRRIFRSGPGLKLGGAITVLITAGGAALLTYYVLKTAYQANFLIGIIVEVYILFSVFAGGDLYRHLSRVDKDLEQPGLQKARASVALLVSRDTANLDQSGISRAALESLFENSADGLIGPLFFAALGGPVLAVFYKGISTLDSMLGYKTVKYKDIGYFAARTDDFLNYIPARLTAVIIVLAGILQGRGKEGWKVLMQDHNKHASPNSAWPEAAAAGVLGLRFGGADYFDGAAVERPVINAAGDLPLRKDIQRGLLLFQRVSILSAIVLIVFAYYLRSGEVFLF